MSSQDWHPTIIQMNIRSRCVPASRSAQRTFVLGGAWQAPLPPGNMGCAQRWIAAAEEGTTASKAPGSALRQFKRARPAPRDGPLESSGGLSMSSHPSSTHGRRASGRDGTLSITHKGVSATTPTLSFRVGPILYRLSTGCPPPRLCHGGAEFDAAAFRRGNRSGSGSRWWPARAR